MVRNNFSRIKKSLQGFTLAEALVAIAVILIGIISMVTLAVALTRSANQQKGRVVAYNLAQEGLEVVRNTRDSNWLNNQLFCEGMSAAQVAVPVFNFDNRYQTKPMWFLDITNPNSKVYTSDSGNLFQEDTITSGEETVYERLISFSYIYYDNDDQETIQSQYLYPSLPNEKLVGVRAVSTVTWQDRGEEHRIDLEERFYNWKPDAII